MNRGVIMVRLFKTSHQHLPGVTLIRVTGELDMITSPRLEDSVARARRAPGEHLVFDLTGVTFIDSQGLRVLLNARAVAEEHGGGVRLAGVQRQPARLFAITRVDTRIPLHPTVDDALRAALADAGDAERRPVAAS
jgi:anti-sigma B factor antagonist